MRAFSRLHPAVLFVFYLFTLVMVISFNNPFVSLISLFSAILYSSAEKKALKNLAFSAVVIIAVGFFNFIFTHYGEDVLFIIKDISFTLEALFFGINQGAVVASVIIWFSFFGKDVDSEKLIWIMRFSPKTALLFSMILGFIPRFMNKQREIREAHLALNGGKEQGRMKTALNTFSALVTYSLESSIITADSMKARGYNSKAVRADRYKMTADDYIVLSIVLIFSVFVIFQKLIGNMSFVFEPKIYILRLSIPAVLCFFALEIIPGAVELWENIIWKQSIVKK